MSIGPGTTLGPYEILSLLGEVGMGSVYKARDPRLGRYVAIKVAKEKFNERFDREARAVAALNHTNICTLHDVGPNYLVMEYIEGLTLTGRIKQGALSVDDALPILRQLIDGIEAAHEKNIYHRDLKPDNIKITPEGVVKILDFGLAKAADPLTVRDDPANAPTIRIATVAGVIMGTPAYMSPEQATGKVVDKRADIWAFGVILWEMLTAGPLFGGETIVETLADVVRQEIDYSKLPAGVPEPIRKILRGCLVRDARTRIRDIGDVRIALEKFAAGEEETAVAPPAPVKRKWLFPALAAGFAMTAVGIGIHDWLVPRPVPHQFLKLETDLGAPGVSLATSSSSLAVSPDGSRVVFAGRNKENNVLFSRRLDQELAVEMPGTEGGYYPFFSHDGRWVGFFASGALKKVAVEGGAAITLCESPNASGASWGEDGNIVAALSNDGPLSLIPVSGGKPVPLTEIKGERSHRFPSVLPGGRGVLFTSMGTDGMSANMSVELFSVKDRKRKVLAKGLSPRYLSSGHITYVHSGTLFAAPFDLERMELKGGTAFPALEKVSWSFSRGSARYDVSRTGTLVYYHSSGVETEGGGLAWVDSSSVGAPMPGLTGASHPRISPDGKRLAYLAAPSAEIWVYDLQRNTKSKLTFEAGAMAFAWTPDSRGILFTVGNKLYWTRSDGASKPQAILENSSSPRVHDISPDGRLLALNMNSVAYLVKLEYTGVASGDSAPRLGKLEKCCEEQSPIFGNRFSPDGKWMAYHTAAGTGGNKVYVRPVPDSGAKWQVSSAGDSGTTPVWSPNGRELYYRDRARLIVVDYSVKGGAFTPGTPRVWRERVSISGNPLIATFSAAPDGKRLIIPASSASARDYAPQSSVLVHFFEEVRRRAQTSGQ
ncbi:MAG: protein kinase [Candidatus Solibacter usitatus]|nr:protein kinase [Candidatus Solibacter usitatus]